MPSWKKVLISGSDAALNTLIVTNGITGSLFGTASYAISASYALTASYSQNLQISGSINNVDYIDFNTGSATPDWKSGRVFFDNVDGALSVYNAEADITQQLGQESWVRVFNQTGVTITNGTAVRLIGSHGDVPLIVKAQAIQASGSALGDNQIIGLATHDIETNSIGYVTSQGLTRGVNTSAFVDGDLLFVSSSAGLLTNVVPVAPYEVIQVGVCVKAGPGGSGIIFVFPTQPLDFGDLSSAERGTYQYGDIWSYVPSGSVGVWRHGRQLSGSYAITGSVAQGAEGNITSGENSHAEGSNTSALGYYSHAEGGGTVAAGTGSHAEGIYTNSSGDYSHAEGHYTLSFGAVSHAEGYRTLSSGLYSHAEGYYTVASGQYSHAEGESTVASNQGSHAEGRGSVSSGLYSHAEGWGTVASGQYQHVQGQYNISSSAQSAFIVGNGTSPSTRSNLIFASGSIVQITGSLQVSASIFQYSNNAAISSGSTANIASFPTSSYMAGFFDYVVSSDTNARAGTVFTVWNGANIEYTETSTNDIGNTSDLILSASISGGDVLLQGTSLLGTWNVKTLARMI